MFEPEDFLETLDRMIDLSVDLIEGTKDEEVLEILHTDLARLRDLQHRIKLQFKIEEVVWH